ncbi:MAG: riboflavin biosynthesis protein RibF [Bacteroidales bacterium]|nr:riboflavin biosynthesis protein RibF [Bacteroidales bacterium]
MAVVATGFFDGVHLGHRQVIQTLVSSARQKGEEAIVVTFAQHPRAVLQQDARELRLLNSPQEKEALLRALGVDRVEVLPFDRAFARLTAEQYVRTVLQERLGATRLVLGYDNRLGSDRLTPDLIAPLAQSLGLEVVIVPPAVVADSTTPATAVSSTKIREALCRGAVDAAEAMLGYAYMLRGVVVGGKQLGRTLGYPTANLRLYDPMKLVPARGVYLTEVEVLGGHYWGMTNVGDIIETHIFDFSEDIYGLDLQIRFRRWLRAMCSFDSLDALKAQLAADEAACRRMLGSL